MKINQITFKVAKLDDPTAKAIGIAVSTDGAVAKELGMSRDQLTARSALTARLAKHFCCRPAKQN